MMKQIALALALIMLTACGFQPVYAPNGGALASGGAISVGPISGRAGHTLRKALLQELAIGLPGVETGASLNIVLHENLTRLAFRPDGAASRSSVRAYGDYTLAMDDGVITGRVEAETNFNVPDAPYADIAAQSDASERAMRVLAKRIVDDLRLKLAGK